MADGDNGTTKRICVSAVIAPGHTRIQQGFTHPNAGLRDERAEDDGVRADEQEQDRGHDERVALGGARRTGFPPGTAGMNEWMVVSACVICLGGRCNTYYSDSREPGLTNQLGWDQWVRR